MDHLPTKTHTILFTTLRLLIHATRLTGIYQHLYIKVQVLNIFGISLQSYYKHPDHLA